MTLEPIYRPCASAQDIREALEECDGLTRSWMYGRLAVVDAPMMVLYESGPAAGPHTGGSRPTRSDDLAVLRRIRVSPWAVAGRAARFDVPCRRGSVVERIRPGAFADAIAAGRLTALLVDHRDDVVAFNWDSTFYAEEDALGLFIAAVVPPALYRRIARGDASGLSVSSYAATGAARRGEHDLETIEAYEVSVLLPPKRPARPGTWVDTLERAERRRVRS